MRTVNFNNQIIFMNTTTRIEKLRKEKELTKLKRKVLKAYPDAHVRLMPNGSYEICTTNGYPIRKPELFLPENATVREAWERASFAIWFDGMVVKSFRAFSDDKMVKKITKVKEEEFNYEKD